MSTGVKAITIKSDVKVMNRIPSNKFCRVELKEGSNKKADTEQKRAPYRL